ncbi:MAG TPA: polysaccharide deacetylase family protein [Chitinophagales bacterium]|nr:polysaccharide deacetylase family protein [Chitinophagales bacterium]
MNQLLIYTEKCSPRVDYIFDFVLRDLLGLDFAITQNREDFTAHTGPKFSYARAPLGDEVFFSNAPLLFETDVVLQPVDFCDYEKTTGFYLVQAPSVMPFDPFASAFLMITNYNEYLLSKKDKYDRYRASQSLNYQAGFLEKPMINYYALEIKKILGARYPALTFKENKFEYVATFDVDMAYSYLEKGFKINTAGFFRAVLLSDFHDVKNRFNVLFRGAKDPFDTYDYIFRVCDKNNIKTLFFFLLGDKSKLDKNISHENERFRDLIKQISRHSQVGIHLSFKSHASNGIMQQEIQRLEEITGQKTSANRYHYLRFTVPTSFMRLIKAGVTEDYSMGYASRVGFRAGTCSPYWFYNLVKNERTNLKIYPFAFMDATFTHYNRLNAEDSLEKILQLMKYVKEVEGPMLGLWHNSSFTEEREWAGWRNVFETVARKAAALTHTQ